MVPVRQTISVVTGCFNEVENLPEFYRRIRAVLLEYPEFDYEFIVADNCSTDGSRELLRKMAAADPRFRVILNAANFGHIRSPFNALLHARGDVALYICSDLQEPPELLGRFIQEWKNGAEVVCAVKSASQENPVMFAIRRFYYRLIGYFSDVPQLQDFTGFGLYGRRFLEALRLYHEPYPYFRGLVAEIGFRRVEVPFVQERRKHGRTKNNFFSLYDMAMTGFVNHTKLPLRLAVFCGFALAGVSLLVALGYFIYKLCYWDTFQLGLAPLVIGLFFFSAVQLIFIGVIGEYIGAIWTQVKNKPLAIEEEKINFDE